MELVSKVLTASLNAIIVMVMVAVATALAEDSWIEAHAPSPAAQSPGNPTSDGTTIDQGIAYVLMFVALILTYIFH